MLRVDVFNAHRTRKAGVGTSVGYVKRVLRLAGVRRARVSIVLVNSRYCRKINKMYLHHDAVTDVISFPLESGRELEGEVYVNLDCAHAQAVEYGVSLKYEVARLIIHGTLHLVGYDDTSLLKAKAMRREEDRHMSFWFR